MKKAVSIFLSLLMVISLIPVTAVSANAEETDSQTEIEYTEVRTVEDLYMISYALDGNYKLMNDIDLTTDTAKGGDWDYVGNGWDPIGSGGAYKGGAFTGIFDGNGYEIKGMRIDITKLPSGTSDDSYAGLFAKNAGTIKNLTVSGDVKSSVYIEYVGAISGYNSGKIENCANKCNINCSYNTNKYQYVGGIAGYSTDKSVISCCYNNGSVKGAGDSSSSYYYVYVAGISNTFGQINDCYNTGNISATHRYSSSYAFSAGISAVNSSSSKISNCYSIGTAKKAIAYNSVTNCYFLGGCGADTTGAKALTTAQMKLKGSYGGFDFNSTWLLDTSAEYYYPQLQNNKQIENASDTGSYIPEKQDGVVLVSNIEDLLYINYHLNENYKLMNDIDLTAYTAKGGDWDYAGNGWEPIGSGGAYKGGAFTGIFDGNGYEIKGMRIDITKLPSGTSDDSYAGLFAKNAGTIKNLTVSGDVKSSVYIEYVGAISGYNHGKIENCANKCNINCSYNTNKYQYVSGIAGYSTDKSVISCCYNNGSVKGAGDSSSSYYYVYVAGISNTFGQINDCYNTGNISATHKYSSSYAFSAGISAVNSSSSKISNCYSIGTAKKAIAYNSVTNCYFLGGCGADTTGAKALTAAQMKIQGVFGTFDFENTWFIDRNLEYQYPQLIHNRQIPKTETPVAIEITTKPEKLSYFTDEEFDSKGLTVSVVYENGEKEETTRYTVSGFENTAGTKTITVTYGDYTASFEVEVKERPLKLTSVVILSKPDKLDYYVGEEFNSNGLKVFAVYENGTNKEITDYTLSGFVSTVGTKTITVEYEGFTATFDVEVKEKPVNLTSITIVKKPDKLNYFVGEEFDPSGLVVSAVYDNNTTKAVTDYTCNGFESTVGTKTITVEYEGFTATFDVVVKEKPVNLTSITIVKKPDKLNYFVGEEFDPSGLVVAAVYDNNTTKAVTDYTCSGFESTVGTKTITVTYNGKTATFDVEVKEKPVNLTSITIVKKPDKLNYFVGEEFDPSGLVVAAVYDNNTTKAVTDYTCNGFESTVGTKTITVEYEGFTATFDVVVKEKPVQLLSINVIKQPDKTVYELGEKLDIKGMILLGVYSNGTIKTIEDYTVSELTNNVGEQTVTVSYEGFTAEFKVIVEDKKILIGDVNGDGKVNGADSGILSRYTSDWKSYNEMIKDMKAADINGDGKVNGADAGLLCRYTSGWESVKKYFT